MYIEFSNGIVRALLKTTLTEHLWTSFFLLFFPLLSSTLFKNSNPTNPPFSGGDRMLRHPWRRIQRCRRDSGSLCSFIISIYLNGNFAGIAMRQLIIQVSVFGSCRGAGMAQGFLDNAQIFGFLVKQGATGMTQ